VTPLYLQKSSLNSCADLDLAISKASRRRPFFKIGFIVQSPLRQVIPQRVEISKKKSVQISTTSEGFTAGTRRTESWTDNDRRLPCSFRLRGKHEEEIDCRFHHFDFKVNDC
jgi:hypothetical protein